MVNPQGNIRWNMDKPSQTIESNQDLFLINVTIYDIIEAENASHIINAVDLLAA